MQLFRIALANIRYPANEEASVRFAVQAIHDASKSGAAMICFPECFVPGYRSPNKKMLPPDSVFLETAWSRIAAAAREANVGVILGTERIVREKLLITALVITADGSIDGFQDKVQLDPSEDTIYSPGEERRIFHAGPLTFGIVICHEGWRYPETVRFAAIRGAQIVFHPHFHEPQPKGFVPSVFADPKNTFHEKAALCRAAENTCYFATVNCAIPRSPSTSAVIQPDGTLLTYQPYGEEGLLIADVNLEAATGLLAGRYRPI